MPAPLVSPRPTAAFPLPPHGRGQRRGTRSDTSWLPSSPSGSGSTAMTLCRQLWIMSVRSCSSSAGSRELSHKLRASPPARTAAHRKHCTPPPTRSRAPARRKGYTRKVQASMAFLRMGDLSESGGSALMNS